MIASAVRPTEINPAKLAFLFKKQLELCQVKPGETMVCVSDLSTRREYIEAAFAAAESLGGDVYEMCVNSIPSWTKVGVPTIGKCKGTLEAMKAADIIVIFHVPLFTKWLKEVMDTGTRVLMIIDAPDDLEQLMAPPGLKEALKYAETRYRKTREVRVVSEAGTDFTYSCGEYPVMVQWGYADEPGNFDHWGAGHIHTFPNEGSAKDGFITKLEGGLDAKLMRDWLDDGKADAGDRDPYAISHLGWGLNPQARWYSLAMNGDAPERQRASARVFAGNFLFSTGPNSQGGGKRTTRGHYDVPMRDCTVMLDNEVIIDKGKITDPKMMVARIATA